MTDDTIPEVTDMVEGQGADDGHGVPADLIELSEVLEWSQAMAKAAVLDADA